MNRLLRSSGAQSCGVPAKRARASLLVFWLIPLAYFVLGFAQIAPGAPAPKITSISPSSATAGGAGFTLTVNGSDFAGPVPPTSVVNWNSTPLATTFVSSTQLTATVPASLITTPGTAIIIVVNPDGNKSNPVSFTITAAAAPPTAAPALAITTTSPLAPGSVGSAYSQSLVASGGTPPYSWVLFAGSLPAGLALSPSGTISGSPTAAGTSAFTAQVADSAQATARKDFSLTISAPSAPAVAITTASLPAGTVGATYSQTLAASGGTPPFTWSLSAGALPAGLTLSASGAIGGTPTAAGTSTFTVQVADSAQATARKAFSITISAPPLTITTASALPAGTVGIDYSQTLTASGGTPPYTWSFAVGLLPVGLSLSAGGVISGIPLAAGLFGITVQVTDSAQVTARKDFSLSINPSTLAITTGSPLPAGTVGTAYTQTFSASGGTPPYSWSIAAGLLPAGLSLAPNGTINGTPTVPGSATFTVQVTDSAQVSARKDFSVTINPPALAITTGSPLTAGTVGQGYTQTLSASGGTPPYSWSINAGPLPAGLSLASTGTISGTPNAAGTSTFTVQVTDSGQVTARKEFSITINPPALTITTASPLLEGVVGASYSQTLAASGGTLPYSWSNAGGSLPPGLTLTASGALGGTPTTAGAFSFSIQVTDSSNATARKDFSLTVNPPGLAITTPSPLPVGALGTAYSQTLSASGGTPPYSWSLPTGSLPPGLAFVPGGTIRGTPAAAGTFNFTVQVNDSAGVQARRAFVISIAPAAPPRVVLGGLPATITAAQQVKLDLQLSQPFPLPIQGAINLSFSPNAVFQADDPAVQFSSGGRSVSFTIPANSTQALFSSSEVSLQTGTVAGTITLNVTMQSGGADITPSPAPSLSAQINRAAPKITNVAVVRNASGFNVVITGLSTPREVTGAAFQFTAPGANLETTQSTVNVGSAFQAWYQQPASAQFGSQFVLTQPFTVQGDAASVKGVSVSLSSSAGPSEPVSVSF